MLISLRWSTRWGLSEVGRRAAEKQPERIRMISRDRHAWTKEAAYQDFVPLLAKGFEEVGIYGIDVLPGVTTRFFVNPEMSVYAVLYDHPKAGVWLNLITLYT